MNDETSSTTLLAAIGAGAVLVLLAVGLPLLVLASRPAAASCTPPTAGGAIPDLTAEQATNAGIIVTAVQQLALPKRAAVIAVATAIQESGLTNVDHGDAAGPDSRGLFQQMLRFYGPDAMIPARAAAMFLTRLAAVPNWQTIPLADAAQAVQRSAFPALYAGREPQAQKIVDGLWTGPDHPTASPPGSPSAGCGPGNGSGPVFLLGDSLSVRATAALTAALAGRPATVDAAVGRTLAQGLPLLAARTADYAGATLVVALCTNYGGDQAGFAALIDQTMSLAAAAVAVEWVTCTEWSPAQTAANAAIRAAHTRYPTITIAEWADPSRAPGMLDPDGVHPTIPTGVDAWAHTVVGALPRLGPAVVGGYALPLDGHWYHDHPAWFASAHAAPVVAIDIPVPEGTPVYAVTAGTIVSAPTGGDCGQGVVEDGTDGNRYTYCHGTHPTVTQGAPVQAGDPIMISGSTGHSTGPHLHFQIQLATGALVCPQTALQAWATGHSPNIATLPTTGCTA